MPSDEQTAVERTVDRAAISGEGGGPQRRDPVTGVQAPDTRSDHADAPPVPVTGRGGEAIVVAFSRHALVRTADADSWVAFEATVADGEPAQQIIGANPTRRRLLIRHDGTAGAEIRISGRPEILDGGGGYKLAESAGFHELELRHTAAVYAANDSGTSAALRVVAEHDSERTGTDVGAALARGE